jgi:hypothetical protein
MGSIRERLIGTWTLLSWDTRDRDGIVSYPLGPDAVGQLSYDDTGRMSAQLMRRNQQPFSSRDWRQATPEEKAQAWGNYFGYFGQYEVDEAASAVVHHIEGSWFANLVGASEVRHYRFEGERLILDADTEWGHVQIVWQKLKTKTAPD